MEEFPTGSCPNVARAILPAPRQQATIWTPGHAKKEISHVARMSYRLQCRTTDYRPKAHRAIIAGTS